MGILFRTFLDFSFSLPLIDLDHLRSQFFRLSWWSFHPKKKKISRDPSFSHYLGGPSSKKKKFKRSQLFPLSWGSFPFPPKKKKNLKKSYFFPLFWGLFFKNFLQRSHFFPLSCGPPPKKKKTKRHQGWG